jgi:transposase InsO family protein
VLFLVQVESRSLHILGVTATPDRPWTVQQGRNLPLELGQRTSRFRYLVRDRAGQFTATVDTVLADTGIAVLTIPPRYPRANAYAERFVLTIRTELTDRLLIFGAQHPRHVLTGYARHYTGQRPHRSRQLCPPRPDHPIPPNQPSTSPAAPSSAGCSTSTSPQHERAAHPAAPVLEPDRLSGALPADRA